MRKKTAKVTTDWTANRLSIFFLMHIWISTQYQSSSSPTPIKPIQNDTKLQKRIKKCMILLSIRENYKNYSKPKLCLNYLFTWCKFHFHWQNRQTNSVVLGKYRNIYLCVVCVFGARIEQMQCCALLFSCFPSHHRFLLLFKIIDFMIAYYKI